MVTADSVRPVFLHFAQVSPGCGVLTGGRAFCGIGACFSPKVTIFGVPAGGVPVGGPGAYLISRLELAPPLTVGVTSFLAAWGPLTNVVVAGGTG